MEGRNRIPRFMEEYARNKSKRIEEEQYSGRINNAVERIASIEGYKAVYSRGLITLDEAMTAIAEA